LLTVLNDHVIHHSLAAVASSGPNPPFVDGRQVARMAQAKAACITRMG
jgi:hypothetical protein